MSAVRLATLTDIDALMRLMRQFYAEMRVQLPEQTFSRGFESLLDDSRLGQVWMIESDGHAAGFVVLTVGFSMESAGLRGFVDHFFIAPPYRRQGLGHAALEEVKRTCLRRGVRSLVVEVALEDDATMNAYRSVGFAESGRCLLTLSLTR